MRSTWMFIETGIELGGMKFESDPRGPQGEEHRDGPPARSEDQAFHEKLAHQPPARGPKRTANRNFTPAPDGTDQQEIRHVCACQQEHDASDNHQQQENRVQVVVGVKGARQSGCSVMPVSPLCERGN